MITITMNDSHVISIAQLQALLKITNEVEFKSKNKKETYEWIGTTLGRFTYFSKKKKEKSIIKKYISNVTGLSRTRIKKLIARKKKTGRVFASTTKRHRFPTRYTTDDIARIIETDNAHQRLSGPATKRIFKRQFEVFGDKRFERLKDISVAHLYNLRGTRQYQSHSLTYTKTNPVQVPIGERRKPDPKGRPGYLRIDTVHQGDLDKAKGVYHINIVDEVTQWEIVGAVEGIAESFLSPLLERLLAEFPFRILGFHSDNGSEFINRQVAAMLTKMLAEQTKSRSRHCNDNALVEGKNGSVIRKHLGRNYIPRKYAEEVNEFYDKYFNEYLNFHRPCGFATITTDYKGQTEENVSDVLHPVRKIEVAQKSETVS